MFERFTDRARKVMALANQSAQYFGADYIGSEHILHGLVKEGQGTGAHALRDLGVDLRRVRLATEQRIATGPEGVTPAKLPQTASAKKVIEHAIEEARQLNHRYVGSEHMLLGLVHDDGIAGSVLNDLGVTIEAARAAVVKRLKIEPSGPDGPSPSGEAAPASSPPNLPFERITDRVRKALALANQEAQRLKHEFIGTEHLLLGLIKEGSGVASHVLRGLGVNLAQARAKVERLIKPGPETVPPGKLPQTPRAKQAIEYAFEASRALNHNYVGTEHLLLGLLRECDGTAAQALRLMGVSLERAREEVLNILGADVGGVTEPMPNRGPSVTRQLSCPMCGAIDTVRTNSSFIAELAETHALLSDNQGPRGWCVLILKSHEEHLADLDPNRQLRIFRDVTAVAAAIRAAFPTSGKDGSPPRLNYECLGNLVPHIHWHIIPRHADDPDPTKPVWGWPEARLRGTMIAAERAALIEQLLSHLRP